MPRDNKKRGRREEKKRKREDENPNHQQLPFKRRKSGSVADEDNVVPFQVDVTGDVGDDFIAISHATEPQQGHVEDETHFHGLLTEDEQNYYANVSNKLDANDFESEDDRSLFIAAVHRETIGKELKVASSQSSSRYLEKVIVVSKGTELRNLIGRLLGHLTGLVQHRFASHVCETLFLRASLFIGIDVEDPPAEDEDEKRSMEDLLLLVAEELRPNLGFVLTEKFGSHVLRALLLILSGQPLDDVTSKGMLAKNKRDTLQLRETEATEEHASRRKVPASFEPALNNMMTACISGLDTTGLRALATHPTGNPVLQLLLRLELTLYGKSKAKDSNSIFRRMLPEDTIDQESPSAKFLQSLIYDSTGSRLVETIVQHAPAKTFKQLYCDLFKDRMGIMARNDTASYVASKILERLGKDDLQDATGLIVPEIPTLVSRYRTGLIKTLIERGTAREAEMQPLAATLEESYGSDPTARLLKMLKLDTEPEKVKSSEPSPSKKTGEEVQNQPIVQHAVDLHGSLLAQAMLLAASPVSSLIYASLLALPNEILLLLAKDATASRVLQVSLTAAPTNCTSISTLQFRRQLIPRFFGHMYELVVDVAGSHLADSLWWATMGGSLQFMKEKLAAEMGAEEGKIRDSWVGRRVWRNWNMDLWKVRRAEWRAVAKGITHEENHLNGGGVGGEKEEGDVLAERKKQKSGIELARERFVAKKNAKRRFAPSSTAKTTNAGERVVNA